MASKTTQVADIALSLVAAIRHHGEKWFAVAEPRAEAAPCSVCRNAAPEGATICDDCFHTVMVW